MPKELVFDVRPPHVFEQGALLVTLLTHPKEMLSDAEIDGSKNVEIGWRVVQYLCVAAYCVKASIDSAWGHSHQALRPDLLGIELNDRQLKPVLEAWRRGLAAGKMAWIFIDQVLTGRMPEKLQGSRRPTLDSVCDMLAGETGLGDAHNFENRIWRKFMPVVHVLAAVHRLKELVERRGKGPVTMGHLVVDPVFIGAVIRKAEEFETILPQSRYARVTSESLVRVRLVA